MADIFKKRHIKETKLLILIVATLILTALVILWGRGSKKEKVLEPSPVSTKNIENVNWQDISIFQKKEFKDIKD